ncbi:Galactinol synthase 1 [Leucoagaricus sp. SymC.cos]|nr:Galactinol synthase 1 [Leucoagaricus sp. SymC.cos]
MTRDSSCAYTTLLTKASYLPGILVLDHGLRSTGSRYPLVVMVTPTLSQDAREILKKSGIVIREINSLQPTSASGKQLFEDRFADTWTKLRAFELFEFRRVVLLDCDMVIRRNMDDLFDLDLVDDHIAATYVCACNPRKLNHYPDDWIPENCAYSSYAQINASPDRKILNAPRPHSLLNSGTVVLNPSQAQAEKKTLQRFFSSNTKLMSYIFPDQDFLSELYEGRWKPISWEYNALRTLRTIHADVWKDDQVRCVHYILSDKPWLTRKNPDVNAPHFGLLHEWWWQVFDEVSRKLESTNPEGHKIVLKYVDTSR